MLYKTPTRFRKSAFESQHGLCCYCGKPMWLENMTSFADAHNYSLAQARLLKCTAEHLHARQDGGEDSSGNIAAACLYCNIKRHARKHPLTPNKYRLLVTSRMKKGKWHQLH